MLSLLIDVLGPVVVIVVIGWVAGPRLGVPASALSPLAYWIFGPAFVFELFTAADLAGGDVVRLVVAGLAGLAAGMIVAGTATRLAGEPPRVRAAALLTAGYGNVGNAGLAITVFALGDTALAAAGVLMLTINVTGITVGTGVAARHSPGGAGSRSAAVVRALTAPMTLAAFAAVLVGAVDVGVPLVADRAIGLLAQALIPVMLLTLGIQLAATGLRRPGRDLGISAVSKLVVAPIVATAVAAGLGLDGDLLGAVAIQSAMPPAVFCMVLAIEHDLEPERVTNAVVSITVASLATLPVVLALVT